MSTDPLAWLSPALADLDDASLRRRLRHHDGPAGPWLDLDDGPDGPARRVLHLCSNSYLGLADHPAVVEAAREAARRYGAGSGASRLVTGGQLPHRELEADLAHWKGAEEVTLFSSGYLANLGVLTALAGPGDTIVSDELNHASIVDACRLARADVRIYRHGDAEHAEALLAEAARGAGPGSTARRVLVTDGVFSMDGDVAPLPALCDAAECHGAAVVVDDAHGSGVVGPDGRGTAALLDCEDRVHAIVGTLSKALASTGGYVAGSAALAQWLRNTARPFIFDTALAAPAVAAAHAALRIARAEPQRRARAVGLAQRLADGLRERGHRVPAATDLAACIVPVVVGSNAAALAAMAALLERDVLAVAIRPPSVAPGTARLRVTTMTGHTDADIDLALEAIDHALQAAATAVTS